MAAPPSVIRSRLLADLCGDHGLSDPFRILYPDKKDYTFTPRTRRINRSRLDFFIISDSIMETISDCNISAEISTELFDHKYVNLTFGKKQNVSKSQINPAIFTHPRFMDVVFSTVIDTYTNHAANPEEVEDYGEQVGPLFILLRALTDLELNIALAGSSPAKVMRLAGLNAELNELRDTRPSPDRYCNINLNCEDDSFLEVLIGNIRNGIISFQSIIKKIENIKINHLCTRITRLKDDYLINQDEIFNLEGELNGIVEENIKNKLANMKLFEGLNTERPCRLFLSLAKKRNTGRLFNIKNPDGVPFETEPVRNEFISAFYEKLYKKPDTVEEQVTIEEFLGPDILSHQQVLNSKLSLNEHNMLETDLTLEELDKSIDSSNSKSAPGIDGISNILLKKIWCFIRVPLHRYSICCYNKGELTQNFRCASVRLIPKKGDISKLNNWRPISLLSNLYKVISRALNNRLTKVVNRICSRAQKGYNNQHVTQEVLINVWETINHCKVNNIRGAMVAIDMAKAFDTLSHKFLDEVLTFFGFGPNMMRWLQLCNTNRLAGILTDDNSLTRLFKLGRGRPQGDVLSPNTFNFCVQILIFKIELDKSIKSIPRPPPTCPAAAELSEHFRYDSTRESSKNESLADDNTTLTLMDAVSLRSLKSILETFGNMSGLKTNFDKSIIMPFLPLSPAESTLLDDIGFTVVTSTTLLGVEICADLDNIENIFNKILVKINSIINFWSRFKLSLRGRLTIMKTLLISQINYIGSFLEPPPGAVDLMQQSINDFVKGSLRVSQLRITFPPSEGGLGVFNLHHLLDAQKCSWIARAHKAPIDNWRYDLRALAPLNNILYARSSDTCVELNPVLFHLLSSFDNFVTAFNKRDQNYKLATIYDNSCFTTPDNRKLDRVFFGNNLYIRNKNFIRTLTKYQGWANVLFK